MKKITALLELIAHIRGYLALAIILICTGKLSYGQTDTALALPIENMTIKELLNIKVVTASKTMQSIESTPATVMVVTEEQIKMRGYQSLMDVLLDLPDMKIDDKVYSQIRSNIIMRGVAGQNNFIIMLDGARISAPTNEGMPIMENYPVNLAQQIEIVYGPSSALYGADAVSGVINIISKKSPSRKGIYVDATSMAGSYGYTNNTLFIAKKLSEDANLVISGQYYIDEQPNYSKLYKDDSLYNLKSYTTKTFNTMFGPMTPKTPFTSRYEAPMQAYNAYAALHIGGFSFSAFSNYAKTSSSFENNTNNAIYNKEVYSATSVNMVNVTYKKILGRITSTSMLTGSEYFLYPQSNFRNLYSGMEPAYKYANANMLRAEQQFDWKINTKLVFTVGGSFERNYSIPQSTDLDNPVNSNGNIEGSYLGSKGYYRPEGIAAKFYVIKYNNMGSFLQVQYSPLSKLTFTLGSRYDINTRYGSTFNPRLGVVYKPFSKTIIKAMYGSAFLSPAPSDAYVQYGSFVTADSGKTYRSYFMHLPNAKLKPIISQNLELSVNQYFTDNFSTTITGYFTHLSGLHSLADDNQTTHLYNNMFLGIPVDYVEVFINQDRQNVYGGSMQLNYKTRLGIIKMTSYAALSYVGGTIDQGEDESMETSPDTELEYISRFILRAGTDMKIGKFSCSPRLILMSKQNITGVKDTTATLITRQTIPGYALLNISLRYNIVKQATVFVNVYNALNQNYRVSGLNMDLNKKNTEVFYGQHADPIRIMIGMNFVF